MSIGSLGLIGSLAGTPLAQAKGSDVDRNKEGAGNHQRQVDSVERASAAAGIGLTQEDSQTSDRDADGRRLWEVDPHSASSGEATTDASAEAPRSKDPEGIAGQSLDLSG
jgi:hypothetical protein